LKKAEKKRLWTQHVGTPAIIESPKWTFILHNLLHPYNFTMFSI